MYVSLSLSLYIYICMIIADIPSCPEESQARREVERDGGLLPRLLSLLLLLVLLLLIVLAVIIYY